MSDLLDKLIYTLPLAALWMTSIAAALKHGRKQYAKGKPVSAPAAKKEPWIVEYITEETVVKEDYNHGYSFTKTTHYSVSSNPVRKELKDYVLVRCRRRYPITDKYEKDPQLRIGAVAVDDPEFDTKLAELRGIAEERASTLNANA